MSYQFSYLIGACIPLLLWIIIFLIRKDVRKEMLFISVFSGVLAPLISLVHLRDWWSPQTCTGTAVGIEDVIFAFAIGGLAVSLYEFCCKKFFVVKKSKAHNKEVALVIGSGIIVFFVLSFLVNSIIGFIGMSLVTSSIILFFRRDLFKYAMLSSLLLVIVGIPIYFIVESVTPGWIMHTWMLENFSGIFFLGIPFEEVLWYFFAGLSASMVYKFWQNKVESKK